MKHLSAILVILLFVFLFASCTKENSEYANGYAPSSINNHSFQFYNNNKWLFSVSSHNNKLLVNLQEGRVLSGDPTFDYKQTEANEAECTLFIGFEYILNHSSVYNAYFGKVILTFISPQEGNYKVYDLETGKLGSSGKFTMDQEEKIK